MTVDEIDEGTTTRRGARRALKLLGVSAFVAALAAPKLELRSIVEAIRASPGSSMMSVLDVGVDASPPLRVDALVIAPEALAEVVRASGTLLAAEAVELTPETSGRIIAIHFEEGQAVNSGDLLVKLQDADLRAKRLAAMRELELARRREQRAAELVAQSFVRQDEHDEALSAVLILEAEVALIEAEIAKTEVRAPFSGTAGLRYISEGAVVDPSTRIATVQRTDLLKVEFAVPERYAGRVRVGSPIEFAITGNSKRYEGRVYALDPHIDPVTRTLTIRAVTPNPRGELFPGAFASVELTLERTEDALMIPTIALVPELDSPYVFVLDDGRVEQRRIVTGTRTADRVQVLSGLDPGDIVITTGLQQLRAGAHVDATIAGGAATAIDDGATTTVPAESAVGTLAAGLGSVPDQRR